MVAYAHCPALLFIKLKTNVTHLCPSPPVSGSPPQMLSVRSSAPPYLLNINHRFRRILYYEYINTMFSVKKNDNFFKREYKTLHENFRTAAEREILKNWKEKYISIFGILKKTSETRLNQSKECFDEKISL